MREKGGKKKTNKNNKKATKDKKPITLRLNGDKTVLTNPINKKSLIRVFNINDIDIDEIKVSDKKLYNKNLDAYKHYAFYEDDNEYIPLRIILLNVTGF